MNYTPDERTAEIVCGGYSLMKAETIHGGAAEETGNGISVTLPGNTGMILIIKETSHL